MTHHPKTPASRNEAAATSTTLLDIHRALGAYGNARACLAMDSATLKAEVMCLVEAAIASRTEQAAPSVASGVEKDGAALSQACDLLSMSIGVLMGAKQKIGFVDRSPIARLIAEAVEFLRPWPEHMPSAAPGAAIAAREQEVSTLRIFVENRANCGDDEAQELIAALASRQEAPAIAAREQKAAAPRYGFLCYSCSHEWEASTPTADCPAEGCGTTNNFNVDHRPASRQEAPAASAQDSDWLSLMCDLDAISTLARTHGITGKEADGAAVEAKKQEVAKKWTDARPPATVAQPVELRGVAETLGDGGGFWRSCSGCHELNEGHDTGPYSAVLKCYLGGGCSECGGIGAIWDTTDYADMADHMGASLKTAAQPCHSQGCGGDGGEAVRRVSADEDKILRSAALDSSVLVAHGRAVEVCPECDIADCRHIRERRRAALSGLEHVGKESE